MSGFPTNSVGLFLLGRIPTGVKAKAFFANYVLNAPDDALLSTSANDDARRYVYNAALSFLSGVSGIITQQAAWAVTKMYYSAFYVGRAALCRGGLGLFHVPKEGGNGYTQYELRIRAGERAKIVTDTPSTHKLVALRFQQLGYPPFMRSLNVEGVDPVLWLMDQREFWQYRAARFPDPDFPTILDQIEPGKIQRLLMEYANDTRGVYLADPAHAIISVPFRLVTWALAIEPICSSGILSTEDISYIKRRCLVGRQTLTAIAKHLC